LQSWLFFWIVTCSLSECSSQNDLTNIPVPDPIAELAAMKLDPAVEVNLFASDPMVSKPIHSNFGYDGKLWIATSSVYPQLAPGEVANDKVIVLEDTDHNGVADKSIVFADGLLIPTGVLPDLPSSKGSGCYVAASTQLLYFLDTDGDGQSDQRRVVLSGFGTEDTHHLLHTLRWGPDGCMYMNQSIYIHSHVETPYGTRSLEGGGVWRFNPRSMRLDVVCKGFANPWGHVFDNDGQSFITDGAGNEGINHIFPGSVSAHSPGEGRWLVGMNPGSPKHCGLEILCDQSLPSEYFRQMVTSDFRSHRVNRFEIVKTDQGYRSIQQGDLIRSEHPAFRPIDTKLGPDGSLYISDWYNPIIQHGEVDFRDPRRDRTHGRVWRLSWKDANAAARTFSNPVDQQSNEELVRSLVEINSMQAAWAKMELARRDTLKVNRILDEKVDTIAKSSAPNPWLRLRCEVEAHRDVIREESITALLSSEQANDRASGLRFYSNYMIDNFPASNDRIALHIHTLNRGVEDADWLVRLEALSGLKKINTRESIATSLRILYKPLTSELDFALWNILREDESTTIATLAQDLHTSRDSLDEATLNRWYYVMKSIKSSDWSNSIVNAFANEKIPLNATSSLTFALLNLVSERIDTNKAGTLLEWLASSKRDSAITLQALEAIQQGTSKSKVVPSNARDLLPQFLPMVQFATVDSIQRLRFDQTLAKAAGQWSVESMGPLLETSLNNDSIVSQGTPEGEQLVSDIIEAISALGGVNATQNLLLVAKDTTRSPSIRATTIAVIAKRDLNAAAQACVDCVTVSSKPPGEKSLYGFIAIVSRKGGPEAFLKAFEKSSEIPSATALGMLSAMQSNAILHDDLTLEIKKKGKLDTHAWKYTPELLADIQQRLKSSADPARGESIYRRSSLQCIRCHAIGSGGNNIGPNLQSIGGSSQTDYILQSLVEPDAKLKEGFQTTIVLTDDGQIITGLIKSRSAEQLQVLTAEGNLVSIFTEAIAEEKEGKSLMPAGLLDSLPVEDLADIVAFMSQLGRNEAYSVSTEPWIRNWQFLTDTPEARKLLNRTSVDSVATGNSSLSWENLTTLVNGKLPIQDLPTMQPHPDVEPFVTVRVGLDCQQAGSIRLKFSDEVTGDVQAWVDSERWPEPSESVRQCSVGTHRLVLTVKKDRVSQLGLQVEMVAGADGVPNSIVVPLAKDRAKDGEQVDPNDRTRYASRNLATRLVSTNRTAELLRADDRIAWLGGRNWEQMSEYGDLELQLTIRRPDYRLRFRNVAWSGDDVEGRARAGFGKQDDGYRRRLADLKAAAPNIVFVAYGQSEALDVRWTMERFESGFQRLIGDLLLNEYVPVVVLPPMLPSNLSLQINVDPINDRVRQIQSILLKQARAANLKIIAHPTILPEMSDDGLSINENGYRILAKQFADLIAPETVSVALPSNVWVNVTKLSAKTEGGEGWSLENFVKNGNEYAWDEKYVSIPAVDQTKRLNSITWTILGLPNELTYDLLLDNKLVVYATGQEWSDGLLVYKNGATASRLALRKAIIAKEQAFFHQYRPQNETYLFLFRKHEQGNNAVEIEQFAKVVELLEQSIVELVKPNAHHWRLVQR